jgi:hypothetical protein
MHENNICFYFFKIIFDTITSKRYKNIKKLILNKKKIKKNHEIRFQSQEQKKKPLVYNTYFLVK